MSNNSSCIWSEWGERLAEKFALVIYRYLTITYIVVGCTGHIILLAAFYKQSKKEKAYGYQVIYSISKILEIFIFGTFLLAIVGLPYEPFEKIWWFHQSYAAMFIFAYLFFVLHLVMIIASLLLAVAMAADRVFALLRPTKYRKIKHRLHQLASLLASLLVGFLGGGVYFFAVSIKWDGEYYVVDKDEKIDTGVFANICDKVRIVSRVGGLAALLALNFIMIVLFKKRVTKVAAVTETVDQERVMARKSREKSLLWINIYQACAMLLNQMPHVTWVHLLPTFANDWRECNGRVVGPACDAMVMITDALDFFIVIAINRKMRKLVVDLPKCGMEAGSVVQLQTHGGISRSAWSVGRGSIVQQQTRRGTMRSACSVKSGSVKQVNLQPGAAMASCPPSEQRTGATCIPPGSMNEQREVDLHL